MPARELDVYLDGRLAGVTSMSPSGALTFTYADAYRDDRQATPLSISMPLEIAEHKNRVVLPFLQGLLPDNAQALSSIAKTYSVSASSPFAMLGYVGHDVAGALQFVKSGSPSSDAQATRKNVRILSDSQIEEQLKEAIREYRDGAPMKQENGRFSLAGAQPKIALHQLPGGQWGLPQDATPTTHIFKPNAGEIKDIDVVEQLTMGAARLMGLNVAESYVKKYGEVATFVSKRYDRTESEGVWRRIHQEDLCQALAVSPAKKYQRVDGGPGVASVARLTNLFPILEDRRSVAREFFKGFVFNVVVGGTDAHAKNYSLLLEGERVRLAPLYDLATFAPYRRVDEVVLLPMNVNGKYQSDSISTADLVKSGKQLGLGVDEATQIVEDMRNGAVEAFERSYDQLASAGSIDDEVGRDVIRAVSALPLCRNEGGERESQS